MKSKEFIPASKPRNFVAKNQKTAGAGAHKDKKRAEKQGDVKHKKQAVAVDEQGVAEGWKSKVAGTALAAANLLGAPAQATEEPVKPITIAYVKIDGEVRKYNLGDRFENAKEAEKFISGVLDKQGLSGYTLDIKHGYPKKKELGVAEADIASNLNVLVDKTVKALMMAKSKGMKSLPEPAYADDQDLVEFMEQHLPNILNKVPDDSWNDFADTVFDKFFNAGGNADRGMEEVSDMSHRDFKRQELQHELGHETNNVSIDINGKPWKVLQGESENPRRALARAEQIAATIKRNAVAKGRKEPDVKIYVTGAPATE
jgi:hypothetical protein